MTKSIGPLLPSLAGILAFILSRVAVVDRSRRITFEQGWINIVPHDMPEG
jgi:hypothetical protein